MVDAQLKIILADLAELKQWKCRQEQDQADRLVEMRNAVIMVFLDRGATVAEILTVLKMIDIENTSLFIKSQKAKAMKAVQTAEMPRPIEPSGGSQTESHTVVG